MKRVWTRVKIEILHDGTKQYYPQVKVGLFSKWRYIGWATNWGTGTFPYATSTYRLGNGHKQSSENRKLVDSAISKLISEATTESNEAKEREEKRKAKTVKSVTYDSYIFWGNI